MPKGLSVEVNPDEILINGPQELLDKVCYVDELYANRNKSVLKWYEWVLAAIGAALIGGG